MPDDTLDLTMEWLVMIAVGLIAVVLGWDGLWELSLVATAIGAVLFLVLLAHEIDPARHRGRSAARTSLDYALQARDTRHRADQRGQGSSVSGP